MRKRTKAIVGAGLLAIVLVGVAGWWFLIRDDAPAAVSLEDARSAVDEAGDGSSAGGDGDGDVSGAWTVDPSVGSFDDFSGSFAGYRVEEELSTIGSTTAVGRTPDVTGELSIDGSEVSEVSVVVVLDTLESDESFRDGQAQRALATDEFPEATFTTTEPIDLGADPGGSTTVTADAAGEPTLHGETVPVTAAIEAELVDGVIVATGSIQIDMTDYGITPPKAGPVLAISDQGEIEFQLFFTRV